ncbi:hypothetical protein JEQ12_015252 [Ovis aries]|uniref:Protein FAM19A5 n=1 Tax=Ovis aries TaxID=9940 RepID=A0A836ALK9_SHEEP|nr:hypothetical protein JEQ12_015252 [Ovis aries]
MQLLKALWALAGAALCCFLVLLIHAQFLKEDPEGRGDRSPTMGMLLQAQAARRGPGQLAAGTCEIVTLDRDSSQPRRTIARQTARCACRKGQIAGTTRARPACVDEQLFFDFECFSGKGRNGKPSKTSPASSQPPGPPRPVELTRKANPHRGNVSRDTLEEEERDRKVESMDHFWSQHGDKNQAELERGRPLTLLPAGSMQTSLSIDLSVLSAEIDAFVLGDQSTGERTIDSGRIRRSGTRTRGRGLWSRDRTSSKHGERLFLSRKRRVPSWVVGPKSPGPLSPVFGTLVLHPDTDAARVQSLHLLAAQARASSQASEPQHPLRLMKMRMLARAEVSVPGRTDKLTFLLGSEMGKRQFSTLSKMNVPTETASGYSV